MIPSLGIINSLQKSLISYLLLLKVIAKLTGSAWGYGAIRRMNSIKTAG
jgi:hypothetical protein